MTISHILLLVSITAAVVMHVDTAHVFYDKTQLMTMLSLFSFFLSVHILSERNIRMLEVQRII